jgi:phage I-like protein
VKQLRFGALSTRLDVGEGEALPSEFRLFKFGENPTSKGVFILTPESAAACMAQYKLEGTRQIVDLEHDSLNNEARIARSDAADARALYSLELRADGIWATNVVWNPDGERRLREKTQPYISPAFHHDDSGVVWAIVNAAMCSMPATYNALPLVAASRGATGAPDVACQVMIYTLIALAKKAQDIRSRKRIASR